MKGFLPLLLASASLAITAHAQNATTTPVGAMTYTLNATTQLTSSYISIPLTASPVFSGAVASVGNSTLTFSGTPFTDGALAQAGSPHFLRIQSGAQAGRTILITGNSNSTLTLDVTDNSSQTTNLNTSGFAVSAGDTAQIIPGDTLASFFGDNTVNNPLLLVGTNIYVTADTIGVYNKSTSRFDAYYYNTTSQMWRPTTVATNANNKILYPDSSIVITRRSGRSAVTFTVTGEVPTVNQLTKSSGSSQAIYASTRYPVNMTLSQLSIEGWSKNNVYVLADTLGVYNPTLSKMDTFYQRIDGTWRKVGDNLTDQSNYVIPAGTAVAFLKRGAVSGSTSFLKTPLPYTL